MANSKNPHTQELQNLLDAVIESYLSATDDEISSEIRERGLDSKKVEEEVTRGFQSAEAAYRKGLREDAQRRWEEKTRAMKLGANIPTSSDARRNLFQKALDVFGPKGAGLLTMQHRELTEYTDADIEQALLELASLGVLDKIENDQTKD